MTEPKECSLRKLIDTVKNSVESHFCFILGAGASVSSGIDSGGTMAQTWLDELRDIDPEETTKWINENLDKNKDIASFYSDLYTRRFNLNPIQGYIWLQDKVNNAFPSLGYYHLASILANVQRINLVITTNFDSLTEDSLFIYTNKKPLVIAHEGLAKYVTFSEHRPIIAKIHRDLLLQPFSAIEETKKIADAWEPVLKKALDRYIPIVVGYGGNDGSLMGLLKAIFKESKEKQLYWCYRRGYPPKEGVKELLNQCKGFLVPINDFDELMYLFGTKFNQSFNKKDLNNKINSWIERYEEQIGKMKGHLEKKPVDSRLPEEKEILRVILMSQSKKLRELTNKITKNPKSAQLFYKRGNYYSSIKKHKEAVSDFTEAIKLDSYNTDYYDKRGSSYTWLGEWEKAVSDFTKAIKLDPTNAEYYEYRGSVYNNFYDCKKAVDDFTKAIEFDFDNVGYYYNNLGLVYSHHKKYRKAVSDFTKAIKLSSANADHYSNRGVAHTWLGEWEKAVDDFTETIKLSSVNADHYSNRGVAHTWLEWEKAVDDFTKAIKLDPTNARHYSNRGAVYNHFDEWERAIDDFTKAIKLDPKKDRYYTGLAVALYKVGKNIDEVNITLEKSLSLDSESPFYYLCRGYIDLKIAKKNKTACNKEVLQNINKGIALINKKHVSCSREVYYIHRAEYHLYVGEPDKAYKDIQRSLHINDLYGRAWYYLAKYYETISDTANYELCINKSKDLRFTPNTDD